MSKPSRPRATPAAGNPTAVTNRFFYQDEEIIEKPFDLQQARRLAHYIAPYWKLITVGFLGMIITTGVRLASPLIIKEALDHALPNKDLNYLNNLVLIIVLLQGIALISNYARIRATNILGQNALRDLRHNLFAHVQYLSFRFFDLRPAGAVLVRITNDVNSLQNLFTNGIVNTLQDVLILVGVVIIMLTLNVPLALLCLVVLPVMFWASGPLRAKVRRAWQVVRIKLARINAHLAESIQGIRVTQAFVQAESNKEYFNYMNEDNRHAWLRAIRTNAWFNPSIEISAAIGTVIVYLFGTHLVRSGTLTIGLLFAFATYIGNFWEPINRISQTYNEVLVAMASSERIFDYMDTRPTVLEAPDAPELPQIAGRIELENVVFEYEKGREALRGVTLVAEPGETVALVGHTGAGKTSIINLVSRFYDVTAGRILIDGIDIRDVTLPSLRRQIGLVLQDTFIFTGTVMDNIRYGRLDATDEEVIAAAKAVRAHEFIMRLPLGYATEVQERGSRLSMGERQLLSFARALLADPRILILDEATASIDTRTEMAIQSALTTLLQGRTSFVIAHRLSTIRGADRIYVLDHGRVIEVGNHESLMAARGTYYGLIQSQFRFFDESA